MQRLLPLPVGKPAALVEAWLIRFPCDFWYRERHKLPLFGPAHKATDLRAVRAEFEQENLMRRLASRPPEPLPRTPDQAAALPLFRAAGQPLLEASAEQIEAEFDALDLDQFNDPPSPESSRPTP